MAINVDEILMKIKVDTSEGVNKLGYLEAAYQKLLKAYKDAEHAKSVTDKNSAYDALGIVKEKIDQQREALGLTGLTLKQLRILQREYAQGWQTTFTEGSEGWKEARQNYDAVSERIKEVTKNTKQLETQNEQLLEGLRLNAQQFGVESLSVTQLEKLSKHLYDTMIAGAGAGKIENHALYQEYVNINKVLGTSKEKLSAVKIVENAYNEELKDTVKQLGIEGLSLDRLKDYHKLLQTEIGQTVNLENEHGKALIDNFQQVGALIDEKKAQIEGTQPLMESVFGSIPDSILAGFSGGIAALGLDSLSELPSKILSVVDEMAKLDDVSSDLEISLNKTDDQIKNLSDDLGNIDTRTELSQLKELAIVAGDLNETDITGFVEQMDKAQIVFSRDFSNVEELANTFGSLLELFPESRQMPIVDFVQSYGSAIKRLNDDGPATTKGIIEFTQRIGQLPDAIKPAASETLGLAAIFEEAKLTAEVSAGGLTNVLVTASQNSALFAKQLKMSRAEVKELINTNPNEFLIKLGESFRSASGTELSEKLKVLKINSQESIKVVGVLSDNIEKLKEKQELTNKETLTANRLDEVFNEKNTNKAAVIAKAVKVMTSWMNTIGNAISTVFMPFAKIIGGTESNIKSLSEKYSEQKKIVEKLEKSTEPLLKRYEELQEKAEKLGGKTKLSKDEQIEMNKAIATLATKLPATSIQFDNYGKAIAISTDKAWEFVKAQKAMLKAQNADLITDLEKQQKKTEENIKRLQRLTTGEVVTGQTRNGKFEKFKEPRFKQTDLTFGDAFGEYAGAKGFGFRTEVLLFSKDYQKLVNQLADAKTTFDENALAIKGLKGELLDMPETKNPDAPNGGSGGGGGGGGTGNTDDEKKRKALAHQKWLQESTKKEIELQAQLLYDANVASANEEERAILEAQHRADEKIKKVREQFVDEDGLIINHDKQSLTQRNLIRDQVLQIESTLGKEVTAIRNKTADEIANQLKEQILKTKELADKGAMDELNAQLNVANRKGKTQEAYILQRQIIQTQGLLTLDGIEKRYQEEFKKLKDNKDAQAQLTKNYETEKVNQRKATNATLDELEEQHNLATNQRIRNAEIERQRQKVQKLEGEGKNPLQAQLVLLNSEMQQELNVVGITEQEKANIRERYRQQETQLIHAHNIQLGEAIVNGYGQAFSAIAGLMQTSLNNRVQKESESYQKNLDNLENEKNKKLINDAEYTKKKKALDDKHKAEERKFKKEQFEITRAENLSKATMETALSILRASPDPIRMGFAGIIGAAQIANILATEPPAYEDGGFTDNKIGIKDKGPGFLARINEKGREFIVPNWQLQDPVVANLVDFINVRRVNKVSGFEDGGYTSTPQKGSFAIGSEKVVNNTNELKGLLMQLNTTLEQLPSAIEKANLVIDFNNEHAFEIQKKLNENKQTQKSALQ